MAGQTAMKKPFLSSAIKAGLCLVTAFAALQAGGYILSKTFVRWSPSTEPDVQGYRVYYGSESGKYTNSVSVGNTNKAVIKGMMVGQTYYFMVTALNSKGVESLPSKEVAQTVTLLKTAPVIIEALVASNSMALSETVDTNQTPATTSP
jgi:fibronectin type 3 domain-containing protein